MEAWAWNWSSPSYTYCLKVAKMWQERLLVAVLRLYKLLICPAGNITWEVHLNKMMLMESSSREYFSAISSLNDPLLALLFPTSESFSKLPRYPLWRLQNDEDWFEKLVTEETESSESNDPQLKNLREFLISFRWMLDNSLFSICSDCKMVTVRIFGLYSL